MPLEAKGNHWLLLMGGQETPSTPLSSCPPWGEGISPGWEVQCCEGLKDVFDLELYLSTF